VTTPTHITTSGGLISTATTAQVIHYELPWNPNRLEQRNGRVDRFGQHKPVAYVRTMVMDETWRSGESNP